MEGEDLEVKGVSGEEEGEEGLGGEGITRR